MKRRRVLKHLVRPKSNNPRTSMPATRRCIGMVMGGCTASIIIIVQIILNLHILAKHSSSEEEVISSAVTAPKYPSTVPREASTQVPTKTTKVSAIDQDNSRDIVLTHRTTTSPTLPVWRRNNPFFRRVKRDVFCHGCRESIRDGISSCSPVIYRHFLKRRNWNGTASLTA